MFFVGLLVPFGLEDLDLIGFFEMISNLGKGTMASIALYLQKNMLDCKNPSTLFGSQVLTIQIQRTMAHTLYMHIAKDTCT